MATTGFCRIQIQGTLEISKISNFLNLVQRISRAKKPHKNRLNSCHVNIRPSAKQKLVTLDGRIAVGRRDNWRMPGQHN